MSRVLVISSSARIKKEDEIKHEMYSASSSTFSSLWFLSYSHLTLHAYMHKHALKNPNSKQFLLCKMWVCDSDTLGLLYTLPWFHQIIELRSGLVLSGLPSFSSLLKYFSCWELRVNILVFGFSRRSRIWDQKKKMR